MGLGCSSELSGFRRDPHLDSKGLHSLVDASSNGCWRSRYTTRYTVCNYVMCDIYIYTHMWMSLYLISSSLLLSYLFLSIIIYVYTYATSASSATPIVNNCTVGKSIAFLTCNCFWSLGFWSLRSASRSWQQGVHCKYIQIVIHIQYTYSVYIYICIQYVYIYI